MARFLIYLLETGICLSLLFLAYWLFLRKETYFDFNRSFLVGSILLALAVPFLHLSVNIQLGSSLERPARSVMKFRQGYGEIIRYLDADFGTEPGTIHSIDGNREDERYGETGLIPDGRKHGKNNNRKGGTVPGGNAGKWPGLSIVELLFILYIGGVIYFFARFVYLVIRLYLLAKRNRVTRQDGFRMVEIEEEISPFSFFRFLFIHIGSFTDSELNHVLEHEKAHISQRHTTDHLFAHALAVFQWFNPLAWQIRKALKTTHEYIADRQVLERGYERIDYQALLLKQVIGYHSVELVNNFNLKPIKKRIAMMNKTKSGLGARLKAGLVAPFAIIIFFLFADFTLKGTENSFQVSGPDLSGLWMRQTKNEFTNALYIRENSFSFADGIEIREFKLKMETDALVLSQREGSPGKRLQYQMDGEKLVLWWDSEQATTYVRSEADNTLDHYIAQCKQDIDLPYISHYRLMEPEISICRIGFGKSQAGKNAITFNGGGTSLEEVTGLIEKEREKVFFLDQNSFTVMFLVDKDIPMSQVDKVRHELRKSGSLHIAEGGYPHGDLKLSPLIYHTVGLPRLLPPLNAKLMDQDEMKKLGVKLHTIDLAARNTTPGDVDEGLRSFISNNGDGKYVISLEYDGRIPYGQYVETVDMIWKVIYSFRNNLAMERFNVPYSKLGDELQREIRMVYPIALSERMK
jgi:hypothetical protein